MMLVGASVTVRYVVSLGSKPRWAAAGKSGEGNFQFHFVKLEKPRRPRLWTGH
jgi:hypothetical protein